MRATARSICLVVGGGGELTDLDDNAEARAVLLARNGWKVHVLSCSSRSHLWRLLREHGHCHERVSFSTLNASIGHRFFLTASVDGFCPAEASDCVRRTLQALHQDVHFNIIEFPALGGLGFRSVQAKRARLDFGDVCLAVRLDAISQRLREETTRWTSAPEELTLDYCEHYAFQHADVQIMPFPIVVQQAQRLGWNICAETTSAPRESCDDAWTAQVYHKIAEQIRVKRSTLTRHDAPVTSGDKAPLVSIAVAHYNLGRYLPEALAALAEQTYRNIEVLVIDDGSTDAHSMAVFQEMQVRYPQFQFVRQENAGIGATRNRGLWAARGSYFIPVDADNIARPDMVERFVSAIQGNRDVHAMTCYFLAFRETEDVSRENYLYANRPIGGPRILASIRNVYGDANAIFNTEAFRSVGGYETDRDTSYEDWEAFVKLTNKGYRVDVVPEHLFYYRHRDTGFSRVTSAYRNHQRVLRQFLEVDSLPLIERQALWSAFVGFHQAREQLSGRQRSLRYRLVDYVQSWLDRASLPMHGLKRLFVEGKRVREHLARRIG
jgi:glycosyltransferase involved in cell wall biosynthesis